ncbi:MAG: hypothetical protein ACREGJ_01610 [Candidatus Saccharimonadales bacterium]
MGVLIGLTGEIGSGKSTFAACLTDDESSHALYETGMLVAEIGERFNQALKAEFEFETAPNDTELVNQVLIWLVDAINEQLHHDVTWNQIAITKHDLLAHPKLYEKLFIYLKQAHKQPAILGKRITPKNKEVYRPLLQWIGGYLVAKVSPTIWYDELMRRVQLRDDDKKLVIVTGVRYPSDAEVIRGQGGYVIAIERPNHSSDTKDVTEAERRAIKPDVIVLNNGTVKDLQKTAEQLWNDLCISKHQAKYTALARTP